MVQADMCFRVVDYSGVTRDEYINNHNYYNPGG
jgi:hypothetical protein